MKKIFLIIFYLIITSTCSNAKTINGLEYFNPDKPDEFKRNCLADYNETQNKINSKSIILNLQKSWEINYIGFYCNIVNGKTDQIYNQLIFFIESMKTNNISENNHSELYELFAVLISPFIEINYPELFQKIKIDKNKINKQNKKEIENLELKLQADETDYTELYTLLGFYIFELAKK